MKKQFLITAFGLLSFTTQAQTSNLSFTKPEIKILIYSGDLSVNLQNDGIEWDQCLQRFKSKYKVAVRNSNGNIPFSFRVKFELNGQFVHFNSSYNPSNLTGYLLVTNLAINSSKIEDGYIYHNQIRFDEGPDISLKATIVEGSIQVGNTVYNYDSNKDLRPRNNQSIAIKEIPYFEGSQFEPGEFDDFEPLIMPETPRKLAMKSLSELFYLRLGFCENKLAIESGNGSPEGLNLLGGITFEKVTCFDSGVPYYHMKVGDKFIAYNPFDGSVFLSESAASVISQWVFEQINHLGIGFRIYNVFAGPNFRLQVVPGGNGCLRNQLFMKPIGTSSPFDYEVFYFDYLNNKSLDK